MDSSCEVIDRLDRSAHDWIARLSLLPADCRDFSIDDRCAARDFGIDAATLDELIAAGLPHVETGAELRFAGSDLHYLALRLGCASPHLQAMSWWADSLTRAARWDLLESEVRCMAYVAAGTEIDLLDHLGRRRTSVGADHCAAQLEFTTTTAWPSFDSAIVDLLEEVAALDFCWIPGTVEDPVALARRTGLADCASAAALLVQECHLRGIPARTSYGLLLAVPYSTPHNWAEVFVEGRWVPADPLLLALLIRHAALDATAWPPTRSPGGVLLRLAGHQQPLATAGGESVGMTFLTTVHGRTRSRWGGSGARPAIGASHPRSNAAAR